MTIYTEEQLLNNSVEFFNEDNNTLCISKKEKRPEVLFDEERIYNVGLAHFTIEQLHLFKKFINKNKRNINEIVYVKDLFHKGINSPLDILELIIDLRNKGEDYLLYKIDGKEIKISLGRLYHIVYNVIDADFLYDYEREGIVSFVSFYIYLFHELRDIYIYEILMH